ncbi:hypothetical protein E2C01_006032 [Portunus trituberculatus]|uniref:Uncharacterized protein n=1 Tax=Portunus trituberculatus TaxID=210409 RepID=A0A5B7CWS5_PORTR|nr:hypothetical protein [Portunus trituberculatus]
MRARLTSIGATSARCCPVTRRVTSFRVSTSSGSSHRLNSAATSRSFLSILASPAARSDRSRVSASNTCSARHRCSRRFLPAGGPIGKDCVPMSVQSHCNKAILYHLTTKTPSPPPLPPANNTTTSFTSPPRHPHHHHHHHHLPQNQDTVTITTTTTTITSLTQHHYHLHITTKSSSPPLPPTTTSYNTTTISLIHHQDTLTIITITSLTPPA